MLLLLLGLLNAQSVVIAESESAADASSVLDVQSTSKGMLIPRMTEAQRELIATPAVGLLVYQTDETAAFYFYNGSVWVPLLDEQEEDPVFVDHPASMIGAAGSGSVITTDERALLNQLSPEAQSPVGTILAFAAGSDKVPDGWLLCDGGSYSQTEYADLFDVIGTNWGGSGGSFNVPDLRGTFLRGVDDPSGSDAAGKDPDVADRTDIDGDTVGGVVGSYQQDAFQGHSHIGTYRSSVGSTGSKNDWGYSGIEATDGTLGVGDVAEYGSYGVPRASSETRPYNAYVNYIIKY